MMTHSKQRLTAYTTAPEGFQALMGFARYGLEQPTIDEKLAALIELRASQINGCAFCTVMHTNDARDAGETDARLAALPVWRDTPWFTERERIALEWTERLTDLAHNEFDDDLYERALSEFGERGIVDLCLVVAIINVFNRLNVPFRTPPNANFRTKTALAAR